MTESSSKQKAAAEVNNHAREQKINLINTVHDQLQDKIYLPPLDDIMNATRQNPLNWEPRLRRKFDQSCDSFIEQKKSLNIGLKKNKG